MEFSRSPIVSATVDRITYHVMHKCAVSGFFPLLVVPMWQRIRRSRVLMGALLSGCLLLLSRLRCWLTRTVSNIDLHVTVPSVIFSHPLWPCQIAPAVWPSTSSLLTLKQSCRRITYINISAVFKSVRFFRDFLPTIFLFRWSMDRSAPSCILRPQLGAPDREENWQSRFAADTSQVAVDGNIAQEMKAAFCCLWLQKQAWFLHHVSGINERRLCVIEKVQKTDLSTYAVHVCLFLTICRQNLILLYTI